MLRINYLDVNPEPYDVISSKLGFNVLEQQWERTEFDDLDKGWKSASKIIGREEE